MKYFIDTEFIEGFHKPLFGKSRHHIDLISIGIVAEDGREYSAVSSEYKYDDANEWVRGNVIEPLYCNSIEGFKRDMISVKKFHQSIGKTNQQIGQEIVAFCNNAGTKHIPFNPEDHPPFKDVWATPEFYGYYADYDWVLLCSLFGTMMQLPKGFPMYCRDLKQMLDEKLSTVSNTDFFNKFHVEKEMTLQEKLVEIKKHTQYPKQENEHNALADAIWNKKLFDFLQTL